MYNSVFQKEWWLDAVAPGKWNAVVTKRGSEIVARLPYVIEKKYGLTILTQPSLTPILGPWFKTTDAKPSSQQSIQKDLAWELLELLPRYDFFSQSFHPSITNWLPFYWKGFEQTTRYTYILEDLSDLNKIWSDFAENVRRNIRKAQKKVIIKTDLDISRFLDINEKTFLRQGKPLPYSREYIKRINDACIAHNARQIYYAEDSTGKIHAALYIIWDNQSAYYLMGGEDPDLRGSEASSLLMWEAIQFASKTTKRFDFEGSMIQPIERFFRGFGGKQIAYSHIIYKSKRMKILQHGRSIIRSITETHEK